MDKNKFFCLCSSIAIALTVSSCGKAEEKDATTQIVSEESSAKNTKPESQNSKTESDNSVIDDILIISRDYCHGWNDFDTGLFITSDGRVYDFDATGRSTDEHSRFLTYEQLHAHLLERMETVEPLATVDATLIINNVQNLELSENEWTSEFMANDIGRHDFELVRNINDKLVFDTLYSTGDSFEGYTENTTAMNIVGECENIFESFR